MSFMNTKVEAPLFKLPEGIYTFNLTNIEALEVDKEGQPIDYQRVLFHGEIKDTNGNWRATKITTMYNKPFVYKQDIPLMNVKAGDHGVMDTASKEASHLAHQLNMVGKTPTELLAAAKRQLVKVRVFYKPGEPYQNITFKLSENNTDYMQPQNEEAEVSGDIS